MGLNCSETHSSGKSRIQTNSLDSKLTANLLKFELFSFEALYGAESDMPGIRFSHMQNFFSKFYF